MRARRIIAVFGGNDQTTPVLKCAKETGRTIAEHGQILLTGGTSPTGDSVKSNAIAGVGDSPWVGVKKEGPPAANPAEGSKCGLVISTGLGDKRNYLEACLCDVVVAFPGGRGTISEVTCSLSLGRPIAFVGEWDEQYHLDVSNPDPVLTNLVERTANRFGDTKGSDVIDRAIASPVIRGGLDSLPIYKYFALSAVDDLLSWIQQVKPDAEAFAGHFPPIQGFRETATAYDAWLHKHAG